MASARVRDDGGTLRYREGQGRYRWKIPALILALLAGGVVMLFTGDHGPSFVWFYLAAFTLARFGYNSAVAAPGHWRAQRHWRRRSWADVDYVITPGRYSAQVSMRLTNGKSILTGFPVECAERIAQIGHRELRVEPKPDASTRHGTTFGKPAEPSMADRAAALHERNVELMKGLPGRSDQRNS